MTKVDDLICKGQIERIQKLLGKFWPGTTGNETIISAHNFTYDAGKIKDPAARLAMLKVLRPYVPHVDVTMAEYAATAGRFAAENAHYDAFLWLESEGMNKAPSTLSPAVPTYAHCLAGWKNFQEAEIPEDRMKLARHFVAKGYPIDEKNHNGYTPTHMALENGNLGMATLFLENGAKPDPSYITEVVTRARNNAEETIPHGDALAFIKYLHEDLGVACPQEALDQVCKYMSYTPQDIPAFGPIGSYLIDQGLSAKEPVESYNLREAFNSNRKEPGIAALAAKFGVVAEKAQSGSWLTRAISVFSPG